MIDIEDNIIAIKATSKHNGHSFSRSFRIAENINEEFITAEYNNNILQLTIPKIIAPGKKEVPVKQLKTKKFFVA